MRVVLAAAVLVAAILAVVRPAAAILDPSDFLALQSIRKALDDLPGSAFFGGWDFTADPCGFPGVFCNEGRVSGLALGDPRAGSPGLTGRLDPAIGSLEALTELSLVPGRVDGEIPGSISQCRNLRFLALSKNLLSGVIPPSLPLLLNLRTLDLSFNLLSGEMPPGLASLPAITDLVLCHNNLVGSIPTFQESSPLLRLNLKHNSLAGVIPQLPSSLQYLSLAGNGLSGTVDAVLPRLVNLKYLDLSMNQLGGSIPPSVFALPLAFLQLQRNEFTGTVTPAFEVSIPVVDLSYNRLYGPVSPMFTAVGQLFLNNNRFTGEVPATLVQQLAGGSGRLQVLYLQHNFLTGIEVSPAAAGALSAGVSLCLMYNCMVPPPDAPCPLKAGTQQTRPIEQCPEWRG